MLIKHNNSSTYVSPKNYVWRGNGLPIFSLFNCENILIKNCMYAEIMRMKLKKKYDITIGPLKATYRLLSCLGMAYFLANFLLLILFWLHSEKFNLRLNDHRSQRSMNVKKIYFEGHEKPFLVKYSLTLFGRRGGKF